jgi:hypothetical protein
MEEQGSRRLSVTAAVLLVLLVACGEQDLVELSQESASPPPEPRFVLGDQPTLSIGGEPSGPASDLHIVTDVVRFPDGSLFISEPTRILKYGSDGTHRASIGQSGQGPGEFQSIIWLTMLEPDTLVAYDFILNRLSYFSVDGELGRTVSLRGTSTGGLGLLSDGSIIARTIGERPLPPPGEIISRGTFPIINFGPDLQQRDTLLVVSNHESLRVHRVSTGLRWVQLLQTQVRVVGDRVYVATGDQFEVIAVSATGGDRQVIRVDHDPVPISQDDALNRWNPTGDPVGLRRSDFDGWPEDKTLPAITRVRVADSGELWVQGGYFDEDPTREWFRLDPSSGITGTMQVPASFRPFRIIDGAMIGVARDDLGVERVQIRPMVQAER